MEQYEDNYSENSDYCFIITNLIPNTDREKLWEIFGEFGTIRLIELNQETWHAAIIYAFKPLDQLLSQLIYINDRLITITQIPLSKYLSVESSPVSVKKLALGGLSTPKVFIEEWITQEYVTFDINLNRNYVEVFFAHVDGYYRFRIKYNQSDFKNSVVLQRHDATNTSSLTISGKYPPHYWKSKIPMQKLSDTYHLKDWDRVIEIPLDEFSRDIMRHKADSTSKDPIVPGGRFPNHTIKLSNWTVYRLEFEMPLKSNKNATHLSFGPNNLSHEALEKKINLATASPTIFTPELQVRRATKKIDVDAYTLNMSFEVRYMIEHAFNLKILREYNVDVDFFKKMQQLPLQVSLLFLTLLSAPQQRVYSPDTVINQIYSLTRDHINYQSPIPEGHAFLRKVIVTPTSIYPLQPAIEPMNHVQYHFRQHADRFLLVQFTDEDLEPILPPNTDDNVDTQNTKIYDRIYQVLRKGVKIAGRTYDFLGTSIDDIRSHQCWFFARTNEIDRADIINWMGDFREISKASTFTICSGQGFAPRLTDLKLAANEIGEIEDYEYNGYIFTTDCGKMSPQIAREIAKKLDLDFTPSVVKFNLAGSKGILMISNFLTKRKVQLRDTQVKFNSDRLTLEVIKVSKPNKVYLNRKIIILLSSLGIPNYVFLDLLNETMTQYKRNMFTKDEISLDSMCDFYSNGIMHDFQNILNAGFLDMNDPYISNLTSAYQNNVLQDIRNDCKLHVEQGVRVFAVMDETGVLGPTEVFLQITDKSGLTDNRRIIEGPCVILRDSSYFPSDMRVVNAVNEPKLRHYTNVLVYSSVEARDIPSAISNDDPDDDNFTVIWDAKLIPSKTSLAPRNYITIYTPNNLPKIAFKEMAKYFTTYISKDRLDVLKKAYIAISDRHKEGVFHGDCIYLSQQLSRALDFAKTGLYATIYSEFHEYPFPDFMEENKLCTYTSKKPSGQIYRISSQIVGKQYVANHCSYDPRLFTDDMYKYIADARKVKSKYDHSLRLVLGRYTVRTEIEFISGHILHWPKYLSLKDKPRFIERIRAAYIKFKEDWRQEFEAEFLNYHGQDLQTLIKAKVAAWYYVTYHPSEYKSDVTYNSTMERYMSFPWVLDDHIASIAIINSIRPRENRFLQAVSAEMINSAVKRTAEVLFESEDEDNDSDDDIEDESSSDSEQEDELAGRLEDNIEDYTIEQEPVHGQGNVDHYSTVTQGEESHVINVKLSDLIM
ncbi:hypothetical protein INT48_000758 [Thamnidium elegans]|uniref:RNA-dependent RNA polymerase n=1 Tax=Thamnidium elegans TaxID=101142 RepID=A0A8H7VZD9_9FUNG|nr:hypothetical protein INT48_000758 [Thamnidium elegans]